MTPQEMYEEAVEGGGLGVSGDAPPTFAPFPPVPSGSSALSMPTCR